MNWPRVFDWLCGIGVLFLLLVITVQWVVLWYVIVVFPNHTRMLFDTDQAQRFVGPDLGSNFAKVISRRQKPPVNVYCYDI